LSTTTLFFFFFFDYQGTPLLKVKGIFLDPPPEKEEHLNAKTFSNMKNLRLLKISNVHLPQGLNYLSGELRFIHWNRFPLESIPTSFELDKLVELNMPCSLIKQLWKGIKVRFSPIQNQVFLRKNNVIRVKFLHLNNCCFITAFRKVKTH
jgi:hypothetical protein